MPRQKGTGIEDGRFAMACGWWVLGTHWFPVFTLQLKTKPDSRSLTWERTVSEERQSSCLAYFQIPLRRSAADAKGKRAAPAFQHSRYSDRLSPCPCMGRNQSGARGQERENSSLTPAPGQAGQSKLWKGKSGGSGDWRGLRKSVTGSQPLGLLRQWPTSPPHI